MQSYQKKLLFLYVLLKFLTISEVSFSFDSKINASPVVPINNHVYDDIEFFISNNLIRNPIRGVSPWTRSYLANLIIEAKSNFSILDSKPKVKEHLLRRLSLVEREYASDIDLIQNESKRLLLRPFEKVALNYTYSDSTPRNYISPTSLDASYNPLHQNNHGRHFSRGSQYSIETNHQFQFTEHLSLFFQPRLQVQIEKNGATAENKIFINEFYTSLFFLNNQLDIGRKSLHWGQGLHGGVILTDNARALDSIQLTNPRPWHIKGLGDFKYSFFLATLGPEQKFDNSLFSGLKVSWQKWDFLELGIARALIFRGDGAPSQNTLNTFGEFFGIRSQGNGSNSISGFEFRTHIKPLCHTQIYSEFYFDDWNARHIFRSFAQDSAIIAGIFIPKLDNTGSLTLRIEGRKNSPIMYRHGTWSTGWALNNQILGDPLGADAESMRIDISKKWKNISISNQLTFERVDSDTYDSNSASGRFIVNNGPSEKRLRDLLSLNYQLKDSINLNANTGLERVFNNNFTINSNKTNFVLSFGADISPRIKK